MPPQGYYGKATTRRPIRARTTRGTRASSAGTVFKPSSAATTRWTSPAFNNDGTLRPSATAVNQGLNQTANSGLGGGAGGYDVSSDPAVAAARGLAAKMRAQATASALARTKQAAIEYGDPTGVTDPTKKGGELDEGTLRASRENPFSIVKNLEHGYKTGVGDLEEGLNKANLFYSGYRGQQLGEAARGYQDSRYQASTRFKGLLTDIGDNLANALLQADMYEANALLGSSGGSYGYGGDGGGGGGSGGSSTPVGVALSRALRPQPTLYAGALRGSRPRARQPLRSTY